MLKFAALGAIAYAGYRYFQNSSDQNQNDNAPNSQNAAAGGPPTGNTPVQPTVPEATGVR
ncbi:hypothetical protein [Parasphingorhabdus sp.]|uniref:hypothetical protein n=1 Tax=Parasphingorhabdus sp. TaxID=2709688 RepID=UPI0035935FE1